MSENQEIGKDQTKIFQVTAIMRPNRKFDPKQNVHEPKNDGEPMDEGGKNESNQSENESGETPKWKYKLLVKPTYEPNKI